MSKVYSPQLTQDKKNPGFNVGANNPDGTCKTTSQWETAFNKLRGLPQDVSVVRLYASSDCNTLSNAVPAALATNTKILVGIWTEDSAHYSAEKAALESAIHAYGRDWILAISVGSEDLYRGDTVASTLAQQIYDVRGMVRALGVQAEVGHVDTYNAWTNSANDEVIKACDFIGMDAYPYWQGSSIEDAYNVFFQAYQETKNHVQSVGSGAWVVRLLSFLPSFLFCFFLYFLSGKSNFFYKHTLPSGHSAEEPC